MNIDRLTDDNFLLYAAKHYDNPNCLSVSDFINDIKKIRYIKRLLNRYKKNKMIKIRLILNHLIILYNLFGVEASTRMLFLKLNTDLYSILKTFLVYLNFIPEKIYINDIVINNSDIAIEQTVATAIRNEDNEK